MDSKGVRLTSPITRRKCERWRAVGVRLLTLSDLFPKGDFELQHERVTGLEVVVQVHCA